MSSFTFEMETATSRRAGPKPTSTQSGLPLWTICLRGCKIQGVESAMRLFTGISLPHEAESRMMSLIGELRPHASLAWTPKDKIHITTKFIGEWPEVRLGELQQALAQI